MNCTLLAQGLNTKGGDMAGDSNSGRVKLIWSCGYCGNVLAVWRVQCTNCQKRTLSWLHVAGVGLLVLIPVIYFLNIF